MRLRAAVLLNGRAPAAELAPRLAGSRPRSSPESLARRTPPCQGSRPAWRRLQAWRAILRRRWQDPGCMVPRSLSLVASVSASLVPLLLQHGRRRCCSASLASLTRQLPRHPDGPPPPAPPLAPHRPSSALVAVPPRISLGRSTPLAQHRHHRLVTASHDLSAATPPSADARALSRGVRPHPPASLSARDARIPCSIARSLRPRIRRPARAPRRM